jgi:hypothetical protein
MNLTLPETQNTTMPFLIGLLKGGWGKGFSAMIESNRKAAYPKWYAQAKGYYGGIRISMEEEQELAVGLESSAN